MAAGSAQTGGSAAPWIETVLGAIPPGELGFCHCHEHLHITRGRSFDVNPALCIDDHDLTLRELRDFRDAGGAALVDAQPVGCGRCAVELAVLSRESGVHILGSTGFHKLQFYPKSHWIFRWDRHQLARLYMGELTEGMCGDGDREPPTKRTGSRAGLIKTALDSEFNKTYEKLFAAAAEAAVVCRAPLMAHIEQGSDPLALLDFLETLGVDPARVILCHMDRAVPDLAVHEAACRRGAYLEYDTVGRLKYHSDRNEADIIAHMAAAGFADRLLLGLDVTRERLHSYGGWPGLPYIGEQFRRVLEDAGVGETLFRGMMVDNPARALARYKM